MRNILGFGRQQEIVVEEKTEGEFEMVSFARQLRGELLDLPSLTGNLFPDNENPDTLLNRKGKGLELYDVMALDPTIARSFNILKAMLLSADWEIQPGDDSADAKMRAKWLKKIFENLVTPFRNVLHNQLDGIMYGHQPAEPKWEIIDGKIIPIDIKMKWPHNIRYHTDKFGNMDFVFVEDGTSTVGEIPVDKRIDPNELILYTYPYEKNGNFYGSSLFREIYGRFYQIQAIEKFEGLYLQNYAMPILIVKYRRDLPQSKKDSLKRRIKYLQDNFFFMTPADWDKEAKQMVPDAVLEFLEPDRSSAADYDGALKRRQTDISRHFYLPDTAGFSEQKTGSFAQTKVQVGDIFFSLLRSISFGQADSWNKFIARVENLNFPNPIPHSKFKFLGLEEGLTLEKMEIIDKAITSGVFDKDEPWIREFLSTPPRDDKELAKIKQKRKELQEKHGITPPPSAPAGPPASSSESSQRGGQQTPPPGTQTTAPPNDAEARMRVPERVDLKRIETAFEREDMETGEQMQALTKMAGRQISAQIQKQNIIEKLAANGSAKEVSELKIPSATKTAMRRTIQAMMSRMYFQGKITAAGELKKGGFKGEAQLQVEDAWLTRQWIKDWLADHGATLSKEDGDAVRKAAQQSFEATGTIDAAMLSQAKTILFTQSGVLPAREIIASLEKVYVDFAENRVRNIVRTESARYFNDGRMTEFQQAGDFIIGYEYVSVLDSQTTRFCTVHDGQQISKTNPWFARGFPPAHFQCRAIWIPVFVGEPFVETWTNTPVPQVGFGGPAGSTFGG